MTVREFAWLAEHTEALTGNELLPSNFSAFHGGQEATWPLPWRTWLSLLLQILVSPGSFFSPGSWILWDLCALLDCQWLRDASHSGMSVTPLHCKPFSLWLEESEKWLPATVALRHIHWGWKKNRREKKTSICCCDIVQTFIFSHTSIHSVILEGPAVLSWLQSMSHS